MTARIHFRAFFNSNIQKILNMIKGLHNLLFFVCLISFNNFSRACEDSCYVSIPNSISSNDDSENYRYLTVQSECGFNSFKFKLFNRWGALIFESDKPTMKFDTSNLEKGTYFWILNGEFCNETEINDTGSISIL